VEAIDASNSPCQNNVLGSLLILQNILSQIWNSRFLRYKNQYGCKETCSGFGKAITAAD
jgi:hypothetical protein